MNRRFIAAATSLALSFTLALQTAGAVQADEASGETQSATGKKINGLERVTEAADIDSARLAAVLTGHRVEALSERTGDSITWVNPDGSLTTDVASGTVRVKENGRWTRIDTTLVDTGSRLEPKTTVADVELSDGGAEDFASVTRGERTFGLDWGTALAAPRIEGDTAVYPSAVPGGDLHVTALPHGFTESLVLNKRPNEPVELRLPVTLKGVKLKKTAERHLRLEDSTGALVASAPAPRMWGTGLDPVSGEPLKDAEIATTVEQTAEGTTLVLRPSQEFLNDPDLTYPVTIDPTTTLAASTDTWVATNYPDSQRGSTELKAGTYDAGTTKARSFLKFDVAKYTGTNVLSAELRLHSYWSASCSTASSGVEARRITQGWDPSAVTWGAQPTTTATGAAVSKAAYGYSSACPANFMRWNVTGIAQAWADGEANHGLQIKAVDEGDSLSWRRFRSANYVDGSQGPTEPALSITYNTKPGVGAPVSPASGAVTADTTPTLQAKASDADGNTVRVTFEVWNAAGTTRVSTGNSAYVASGGAGSWTAPALPAGTYKWRVTTYDGTDWNGTWSVWRTLTIDTSIPAAPSIASTAYPDDGLWHGDAGTAGAFTLTDPAGKAVSVEYALDQETVRAATLTGGKAVVTITPATRGVHSLTARVKNAAGTWSEWGEYTFRAGSLSGNLSTSFINEIAETHFSAILHPAEDEDEITEPTEDIAEEDDTPPGYVEEEDPEKTEDEESVTAGPVTELPATADSTVVGTSADGNTQTLIDLPVASISPAELSSTGLVIYPNTQRDADIVAIRSEASQVELFHLLRTANAPHSFTYTVDLQPGQEMTAVSENTVMIADGQEGFATFVSAPVAIDAKGNTVPVSMTTSGSAIVISLAPAAGQTVHYPVLLDPSAAGYGMTPSEKRYCLLNPYDCSKARDQAEVAVHYAKEYYADKTLFQGTGDAFRHCYWNATMEIFIDHETAYEVATRHESESRGNDKEMDLRNNKIGRAIGRNYKSNNSKATAASKSRGACKSYVSKGKLWIIKSGKLVRSNA
ncbi:DNRLRE domain-containing protein [Streptomyces sp. NBC_01669]|uniref:DNRLRE domain-containing protein n=1 Tax=Streptomyces sp. NBC_01669 TaxID=2975909 RepID=UPI00225B3B20|nr:DNRLRE domain-containing protein [Streptomyces sp. NBC_01669]MCX4531652.1 DNRLRE domain-containing protein [Streptomyces sp. NBC_01669]